MFVKASLDSVLMGGLMAAGLTAMMILLFLGNWRLTLIILATIPLAIITAVLVMYVGGQTLNTMTLGGFALAVGILVDNGTVVIENIERHVHDGEPLTHAIVVGAGEVATPTVLSTICICIVFVPVFLLQGTAKYLFSPLSLVGLRVAGRQPRAVVHAGAGAVRRPDALFGRPPAGGIRPSVWPDARDSTSLARSTADSRAALNGFAKPIATASPFAWRVPASPPRLSFS